MNIEIDADFTLTNWKMSTENCTTSKGVVFLVQGVTRSSKPWIYNDTMQTFYVDEFFREQGRLFAKSGSAVLELA